MRVVIIALGIAAALLGTTACSGTTHPDPPPGSSTSSHASLTADTTISGWLMTRAAIAEVSTNPAVRARFSATPIDELLTPGQRPLAGVPARPVVSFASATALQAAVRQHTLPAHTYAVLYDPEVWAFTPLSEQRDPVAAATRAATTAHAHGLRLIVAPALNLTTVRSPAARAGRESRFLASRLAGRIASVADALELQAQSLERDRGRYRAFVVAATAQARRANPKVRLLAGLSTNPPGAVVSVAQLHDDIDATRSVVNGYWLNVPGRGARCPTCSAARPQSAIALVLRP